MKRIVVLISLLTAVFAGVVERVAAEVAPPPPKPECHDIVYRKWTDMLFVDNGNEEYSAYQWYRNNVAIDGQTGQYLYIAGVTLQGDGNIYHVVATKKDGSQIISCEGRFEDFDASAPMNQGIKTVKAVLYNYAGEKIAEWSERPARPSVPGGCYIWLLTDEEGKVWSERVLY